VPDQVPVGLGFDGDRLLKQPVEQLPPMAACSPVETECEFIEVVFQMLVADGPLMGTKHPSLQE